MTDIAVGSATSTDKAAGRRPRLTRPGGLPSWLWMLGVAVTPVGVATPGGRRAWVVSAGAGTTGMATVIYTADHRTDITRRDQT